LLHPSNVLVLAIERVNETFRNSGMGNVSEQLIHTGEVDYDERGSEEFTDLYRIVNGEGAFKDVRRHLRNENHATIVGMVVDDPRGCGYDARGAGRRGYLFRRALRLRRDHDFDWAHPRRAARP
jgi:hypothetical protein